MPPSQLLTQTYTHVGTHPRPQNAHAHFCAPVPHPQIHAITTPRPHSHNLTHTHNPRQGGNAIRHSSGDPVSNRAMWPSSSTLRSPQLERGHSTELCMHCKYSLWTGPVPPCINPTDCAWHLTTTVDAQLSIRVGLSPCTEWQFTTEIRSAGTQLAYGYRPGPHIAQIPSAVPDLPTPLKA